MEQSLFTESNNFIITAIILVGYEIIKTLISMGLRTKATVEDALWRKGVTDSLTTLVAATVDLRRQQDEHKSIMTGVK
jgi:hypothetical protein